MKFKTTSIIFIQWALLLINSYEATETIAKDNGPGTNYTSKYLYEIKKFKVPVDHFSFALNDTFKIRYLYNNTWQSGSNPPIFFYTGNEGRIETFAENTGFIYDIAPEFNALIIFAEHRYYGESMPYGNRSFTNPKYLGYLTSQQAMADYVDLIQHLKSNLTLKHSPVIVFGGSYGGMLSAWIRMKYPHIIQGAIAASAPILQFTGVTDCQAFARIVTSNYRAANPACSELIRASWDAITNETSTEEGRQWFSTSWKLCSAISNSSDVQDLKDWLSNVYSNIAMINYPYKADFLAPVPAFPVAKFCEYLSNSTVSGRELLQSLKKAVNVYTNYTGKTRCLNVNEDAPDLDAQGWDYQACTEMVMPMCSDGLHDMFEPRIWSMKTFSDECYSKYKTRPQASLACEMYGCTNLNTATNIVFSNGLLDPWSSGGVLTNLSASATAVIIPEGAHHLDLRGRNPADPYSVIQARNYHRSSIKQWIKEYSKMRHKEKVFKSNFFLRP